MFRVFFFFFATSAELITLCSPSVALLFLHTWSRSALSRALPSFISHSRSRVGQRLQPTSFLQSSSYRPEGGTAKHWTFCDGLAFFTLKLLFLWRAIIVCVRLRTGGLPLCTLRSAVRPPSVTRPRNRLPSPSTKTETSMSFSVSEINHSILISESTACRRLHLWVMEKKKLQQDLFWCLIKCIKYSVQKYKILNSWNSNNTFSHFLGSRIQNTTKPASDWILCRKCLIYDISFKLEVWFLGLSCVSMKVFG